MGQAQAVIAWCMANKAAFLGIVSAVATLLNQIPANVGPSWIHSLDGFLGRIAAFDKGGHLSIPLIQGNAPAQIKFPPAAAALICTFLVMSISACNNPSTFCAKATNTTTDECKLYRVVVSCGPGLAGLLDKDAQDVLALNYVQILSDVATQFPAEYECVSTAINAGISVKFGQSSNEYLRFKAADISARAKMLGHSVQ